MKNKICSWRDFKLILSFLNGNNFIVAKVVDTVNVNSVLYVRMIITQMLKQL